MSCISAHSLASAAWPLGPWAFCSQLGACRSQRDRPARGPRPPDRLPERTGMPSYRGLRTSRRPWPPAAECRVYRTLPTAAAAAAASGGPSAQPLEVATACEPFRTWLTSFAIGHRGDARASVNVARSPYNTAPDAAPAPADLVLPGLGLLRRKGQRLCSAATPLPRQIAAADRWNARQVLVRRGWRRRARARLPRGCHAVL